MVDEKRFALNRYGTRFEGLQPHMNSYQASKLNAGFSVDSSLRMRAIFSNFQPIKYHICIAYIKSPFYVNLDVNIYQNYIAEKKENEMLSFCDQVKKFANKERFYSLGTIKDSPTFIHKLHVKALAQFKAIAFGNSVGKVSNSLPHILFIPLRNISMISSGLSYNQVN